MKKIVTVKDGICAKVQKIMKSQGAGEKIKKMRKKNRKSK